jgi:hypothetical protein
MAFRARHLEVVSTETVFAEARWFLVNYALLNAYCFIVSAVQGVVHLAWSSDGTIPGWSGSPIEQVFWYAVAGRRGRVRPGRSRSRVYIRDGCAAGRPSNHSWAGQPQGRMTNVTKVRLSSPTLPVTSQHPSTGKISVLGVNPLSV